MMYSGTAFNALFHVNRVLAQVHAWLEMPVSGFVRVCVRVCVRARMCVVVPE